MNEIILHLQHIMKKKLDEYRYEHTLGVMYTAAALAMKHKADINQALLAGLLHDCAKCYSDEKKRLLCDKYNVTLSQFEIDNPALIHAKLGAVLANKKYEIEDEAVCSAIACHTTGAPGMTKLDKIVFIADYIEPHRNKAQRLDDIRYTAFENLDEAVIMILCDTLDYLKETTKIIDPMTQKTYEYYIKGGRKS